MKKQIAVVGAVLTRGNKILAAKRGPGMSLPGLWEFPGGKIESGETPHEALAREIAEELRCEVAIGALINTAQHEYDFGVVHLTTFYCALIGAEPTLTEHEAILWVDAAELDTLEWAPADLPAVRQIMKDATTWT